MSPKMTKSQKYFKEQRVYEDFFHLKFRLLIICSNGTPISYTSAQSLKGTIEDLIDRYNADDYFTAYVTPESNGLLKLVESKPVEITREQLERIIKELDYENLLTKK